MKKFIQSISVFVVILFAPFIIWVSHYGFPPPDLSLSLSFNAKSLFVKKNDYNNQIKILAIGSSMTLNNISSESIIRDYGEMYLNFSSWGQSIEEDYNLIKIFEKHLKPRIIIMSCNIMDFDSSSKDIRYKKLENFLFSEKKQLMLFPLGKRFLLDSRSFYNFKQSRGTYQYLKYDNFGGVNLESENFKIIPERWNGRDITDIDNNQYLYLDSIASLCNEKNIRLVFIQSPFREGWISKRKITEKEILNTHITNVHTILNKTNNSMFINSLHEFWSDSLFVDYSHLNNVGSKRYTDFVLEKMKEYKPI